MNFFHLLISSVDGKQHLSEVVFNALVEFSLQGKLRKDLVSASFSYTQKLITSDYGVHEVGVTICEVQNVSGVRYNPETKSLCHFPYNENPTIALNTTSLKCCLPSTDAVDRREKMHAYL